MGRRSASSAAAAWLPVCLAARNGRVGAASATTSPTPRTLAASAAGG